MAPPKAVTKVCTALGMAARLSGSDGSDASLAMTALGPSARIVALTDVYALQGSVLMLGTLTVIAPPTIRAARAIAAAAAAPPATGIRPRAKNDSSHARNASSRCAVEPAADAAVSRAGGATGAGGGLTPSSPVRVNATSPWRRRVAVRPPRAARAPPAGRNWRQ